MRFRLRTLLIILALGSPILAGAWLYPLPAIIVIVLYATLSGPIPFRDPVDLKPASPAELRSATNNRQR